MTQSLVLSSMELGSYIVDLGEKLGQGSFGIVYRGRVAKSGDPVAVKQLEIRTDDHGTRALDEIKKYERLPAHPNLVKLLDFHYKNNAFWLVLEHCNGGNLDEFAYMWVFCCGGYVVQLCITGYHVTQRQSFGQSTKRNRIAFLC